MWCVVINGKDGIEDVGWLGRVSEYTFVFYFRIVVASRLNLSLRWFMCRLHSPLPHRCNYFPVASLPPLQIGDSISMLIVYAGYSDDVGGGVVNDIWIYDINTNLWQTPGNYSAISDAQVSFFRSVSFFPSFLFHRL